MSTQTLPTLSGLGWSVKRTPLWMTRKQESISGKRTFIADWSFPRWRWELTYDFLRQAGAHQQVSSFQGSNYGEFAQLAGFFNERQGAFDSFLYSDPDDNTVTGQGIGEGDGATTAFQLVRAFGGFVEPILAPNSVTAVYLAGVSIPSAGIAAPSTPSISQVTEAGASGGTRYAKATYVTNSGETGVSGEAGPLTVTSGNALRVASPSAETGAIGWNVYAGTASGGETKQNTTPISIGTAWTEPSSGLIAGSPMPSGNATGWSVSSWGATTPGVLTFQGAPASAIAITADFSFYFAVSFADDSLDFEKFMGALYNLKKVVFESIK